MIKDYLEKALAELEARPVIDLAALKLKYDEKIAEDMTSQELEIKELDNEIKDMIKNHAPIKEMAGVFQNRQELLKEIEREEFYKRRFFETLETLLEK